MSNHAHYIQLGALQLTMAGGMIACLCILLWKLKLPIFRQLALASAKTTAQLVALGFFLKWIFNLENWILVTAYVIFMTIMAAITAVHRQGRRIRYFWIDSFISVGVSAWLVVGITVVGIIQIRPWYTPQYFIPLAGMILGNILNGVSLAVDRFLNEIILTKEIIESSLAHGATRFEAAKDCVFKAAATGMTPIMNSMTIAGVVSLPGMMTGQILAGVDPMDGAKYQVLTMLVIASATGFATITMLGLLFFRVFNNRHQLEYWRIQ